MVSSLVLGVFCVFWGHLDLAAGSYVCSVHVLESKTDMTAPHVEASPPSNPLLSGPARQRNEVTILVVLFSAGYVLRTCTWVVGWRIRVATAQLQVCFCIKGVCIAP